MRVDSSSGPIFKVRLKLVFGFTYPQNEAPSNPLISVSMRYFELSSSEHERIIRREIFMVSCSWRKLTALSTSAIVHDSFPARVLMTSVMVFMFGTQRTVSPSFSPSAQVFTLIDSSKSAERRKTPELTKKGGRNFLDKCLEAKCRNTL